MQGLGSETGAGAVGCLHRVSEAFSAELTFKQRWLTGARKHLEAVRWAEVIPGQRDGPGAQSSERGVRLTVGGSTRGASSTMVKVLGFIVSQCEALNRGIHDILTHADFTLSHGSR